MAAPPVVLGQRPRISVTETVGVGGPTDTSADITRMFGDISTWSEDQVRGLAVDMVVQEVKRQERLDNPLTSLLVDNAPFKPLFSAKRSITANFGGAGRDLRPAMREMEEALGRFGLEPRGVYWTWLPGPGFPQGQALSSASPNPIAIDFGQKVYLVPRGPNEQWLARFNQQFVDALTPDITRPMRMRAPSPGRAGGLLRMKRSVTRRLASLGFWAKAGMSERRASQIGRAVGRRNTASPRTGRNSYRQGVPYFVLQLRIR